MSDSIQSHVLDHLHYTPRRLLFEEFSEKLDKIRSQRDIDTKAVQSAEEPVQHDYKFLNQLNDFRMKNAHECMSEVNFRRFQRENEKVENYLKHSCVHRFRLNDRLIPVPVKSNELGQSLCIICSKAAEPGSCNAGNSMILNESKFDNEKGQKGKHLYLLEGTSEGTRTKGYEKSFALKYQKFK